MLIDWWHRLAHYRKQAGFTQEEAGRTLGLSRQTLSRIEQGNYPVKMHTVMAMLDLYGVDWSTAFGPVTETLAERMAGLDRVGAEHTLQGLVQELSPEQVRALAAVAQLLLDRAQPLQPAG